MKNSNDTVGNRPSASVNCATAYIQKIMFYSREVYVPRESSLEDVLCACTYIFVILCLYVYRRQKDVRYG